MNSRPAAFAGSWFLSAWRRAPVAVVLVGVVLVGLLFAGVDGRTRDPVIGVLVLVLDLVGAFYSWRAGPFSPSGPVPWRLLAAARAVSVASTVCLAGASSAGSTGWWWAGTSARLLVYVLLAAGVLWPAVKQFTGRARIGLFAELVTVVAAGFMVVWYFTVEPAVAAPGSASAWPMTIGWPLGDVVLLAAVASIALRGVVTRFSAPIAVFTAGLTVYLASDVLWAVSRAGGVALTQDLGVLFGMVIAALLLTCAPVLTVAQHVPTAQPRRSRPPAWATHLPMAAMLVGCLLMLTVTIIEDQLLSWGGLVCGLIVMTGGASARQLVWLRDNRERYSTDELSGLSNRVGFDDTLSRAARRNEPAALLLFGLDGFKLVNDAYGHAGGDAFLTHVGRQLREAVRGTTVCARMGGDEFAVLIADVPNTGQAAAVAKRILAACATHPFTVDGDSIPVRASMGVAHTQAGFDPKNLMRQADIAMYHAKRAGRHGYACYEPSMVDHRATDATLAEDLEHALERGQLHVVYQPQVDLTSGKTVAAEALLRWQHPVRGPVSPIEFIPIAERTGSIIEIGLWVLDEALHQLAALPPPAEGGQMPHMSVNLSPRQLREPTIVPDILATLRRADVHPQRLVLEVTESAIVDDTTAIAALSALREHGIQIAIDDFGTGYSSLQYLTRLPVDILKIDRSFVTALDNTQQGSAVAEVIIRLAQILRLDTVAEGIETQQEAAELHALGCAVGQGYLFAKPLPPHEFTHFVATSPHRSSTASGT